MPRILGLGAIVVGAVLLFFGMKARDSVSSQVKEIFTGSPTDNSVLYLACGGGLAVAGVGLLVFGRKM